MRRTEFPPEGRGPLFPEHQSIAALEQAMREQTILHGKAVRCDSRRSLWVRFGGYEGEILRCDAVHPAISGAQRDIAVLSRVGREVCFTITQIETDGLGRPQLLLSRRRAQEQALAWLLEHAPPGTVLPARVTHLASFGAFVDLGCGVISMIPTKNLSVSPVEHPADRLQPGQDILALVTAVDTEACRFYLSHRELLGTWLENAAAFVPGDTVTGVVRGIREYGIFVELRENLTGLADWREDVHYGDLVSVYIKSIRPENRKIKLQIIQDLGPAPQPGKPRYCITDGTVEDWDY